MPRYRVHCKQIVETPSDADDREELNLGKNEEETYDFIADDEDEALDRFHGTQPLGCLEDYEVWAERIWED